MTLNTDGHSAIVPGQKRKPTSFYRKLRRTFSKTSVRIPVIWYRHHGFRSSDVFFATYPRSGTTWSRWTLFEVLTGEPAGFKRVNETIPGVGRHENGVPLLPGGGRLIGTHEQYRKQYHRAIYVVRDGRDVLLSEFAYLRALDVFHGDLDDFVRAFLFTRVSGFGPWHRHVTSWLDSPLSRTSNLLVVRYEDLRQNPTEWFRKMAEFLGLKVSDERIQLAVANTSLENMRAKERVEPVRASVNGRFVRNGLVRGWRSQLTSAHLELIEQHAGSLLKRLGHPLSTEIGEPVSHGGVVPDSQVAI